MYIFHGRAEEGYFEAKLWAFLGRRRGWPSARWNYGIGLKYSNTLKIISVFRWQETNFCRAQQTRLTSNLQHVQCTLAN